ncbi:protein of unknown function [Pseudorhizobium banfieldiae]|uniref:Uncharacterized protein n=1 Tax=Pseudorhizobium banfieldiae TaxID=1125847 RepID=L0NLI8_9HYPH|nr:protein of unknown function [Pseudorhizobium banfieldiae]
MVAPAFLGELVWQHPKATIRVGGALAAVVPSAARARFSLAIGDPGVKLPAKRAKSKGSSP